jgi:Uma2 family endonuclease
MSARETATLAPWARPRDDGPRPYSFSRVQFEWMRARGFFDGRHVELSAGELAERTARGIEQFRLTLNQYQAMADAGLFDSERGERVELIDGEVIQMAAMSEPHAVGILLSQTALQRAFGDTAYIRTQMPFSVPGPTLPEPDLAVIAGSVLDHPGWRPSKAELLVEVCMATAIEDRGRKPYLYAAAGVPEYWLLDLVTRRLEVYRQPLPDVTSLFGHRYGSVTLHGEDESIAPLAKPGAAILVSTLMLPAGLASPT